MRNSRVRFATCFFFGVMVFVLVGCAAVARDVWVKPGDNRPVSCLGVLYSFGPYPEWAMNQDVLIYARIFEQHVPELLAFNGVRTCGVGPIGVENDGIRDASHVLLLRSSSGWMNPERTIITLVVDVDLVDQGSKEVVFRALATAPVEPNEAAVSRLVARAMNSLSKAGLVSLPKHHLRYEAPIYRGDVITE